MGSTSRCHYWWKSWRRRWMAGRGCFSLTYCMNKLFTHDFNCLSYLIETQWLQNYGGVFDIIRISTNINITHIWDGNAATVTLTRKVTSLFLIFFFPVLRSNRIWVTIYLKIMLIECTFLNLSPNRLLSKTPWMFLVPHFWHLFFRLFINSPWLGFQVQNDI